MKRLMAALGAICFMAFASHAVAAEPTDTLQRLVTGNQFQQAYEVAQQYLAEMEGLGEFDFLYGLAALGSGHYSEATYALHRAALTFPKRPRIRLELGRAHFLLGNYAEARAEFIRVQNTNPPPAVQRNIDAFLASIDAAEKRVGRSFSYWVDASSGHDSNINQATENDSISIPIFGLVNLSDNGQETDDGFFTVSAGARFDQPISKVSAFDLSGSISNRDHFDTDAFDQRVFRLEGGYSRTGKSDYYRYGLRSQLVELDEDKFQYSGGFVAQWVHQGNDGWVRSLLASVATVRYAADHDRDTDQVLAGVNWNKTTGALSHSLGLFGAVEPARHSRGEHNGRYFGGATYAVNWQLSSRHQPFMRVNVQAVRYEEDQPVFGQEREDEDYSVTLGWLWNAGKRIAVRLEGGYTEHPSNLDIFDYDRSFVEAGVRIQLGS